MTIEFTMLSRKVKDHQWPLGNISLSYLYNVLYPVYSKIQFGSMCRELEDFDSALSKILWDHDLIPAFDSEYDRIGYLKHEPKQRWTVDEKTKDTWLLIKEFLKDSDLDTVALGVLLKGINISFQSKTGNNIKEMCADIQSPLYKSLDKLGYYIKERVSKRGGRTFWVTKKGKPAGFNLRPDKAFYH